MSQSLRSFEGLVLRKTEYSESSLIFVLLTRDVGQQHVLLKGARKTGKRKFPAIDLFRNVSLNCTGGANAELFVGREAELLNSYDRLASYPNHFRAALWLCRFAERNTVREDPCPEFYEALRCAFDRLSHEKLETCLPVCLGVILCALDEHGYLPDLEMYPQHAEALDYMLAYAVSPQASAPKYTIEQWQALYQWAIDHLFSVGLAVPQGSQDFE